MVMMKGTETSKLLAALREATARLRMNATNSFARFTARSLLYRSALDFRLFLKKVSREKFANVFSLFQLPVDGFELVKKASLV